MSALRKVGLPTVGFMTFSRGAVHGHIRSVSTASRRNRNETEEKLASSNDEEEFRVYEIEGLKKVDTDTMVKKQMKKPAPPRFSSMPIDQDWTNVWPTASTFKWSVVPFPVRQGYVKNSGENEGIVPPKYANLELMKGPNFLHLTPAHIKKHCEALKQFCTQWPEGLETDERCRKHFPIESVTSDFVFAAPSIRDPRARCVQIKFHLSDLELDYHARDKFIRLVGERYNKETDEVIFESNRCPLKSQNLEYLKFILTAVYFESWKRESWEDLKELSDMERYIWDMNTSRKNLLLLLKNIKTIDDASGSEEGRLSYLPADVADDEALCSLPQVGKYKSCVEEIFGEGENITTINNYKNAVKELLNIQGSIS